MLLIFQRVYRHSGQDFWRAAIEVESPEAARIYIAAHSDEWEAKGDGRGTNFAIIPDGCYTAALSGEWAWTPAQAEDVPVDTYDPY